MIHSVQVQRTASAIPNATGAIIADRDLKAFLRKLRRQATAAKLGLDVELDSEAGTIKATVPRPSGEGRVLNYAGIQKARGGAWIVRYSQDYLR